MTASMRAGLSRTTMIPCSAKLIAWGEDRAEAIARLRGALDEYYATGIKTNLALFRRILDSHDFQQADLYTRWLDDFLRQPRQGAESNIAERTNAPAAKKDAAILAFALWHQKNSLSPDQNAPDAENSTSQSTWKQEGRREQLLRGPAR